MWIYGGGFTNGDARDPIHEAARLVEKHQVVVVTLNYRLGLLGFPPLSEAANLGCSISKLRSTGLKQTSRPLAEIRAKRPCSANPLGA